MRTTNLITFNGKRPIPYPHLIWYCVQHWMVRVIIVRLIYIKSDIWWFSLAYIWNTILINHVACQNETFEDVSFLALMSWVIDLYLYHSLTSWGRSTMVIILQMIYYNKSNKIVYLCISKSNAVEMCSHGLNWQQPIIHSDNVFAPKWCQWWLGILRHAGVTRLRWVKWYLLA